MFAKPIPPAASPKPRSTTCPSPSATASSWRSSGRRVRGRRRCSTSSAGSTTTTRATSSSTASRPRNTRIATGTHSATTASGSSFKPTISSPTKPSWRTWSWRSPCRASREQSAAPARSTRCARWALATMWTRSQASSQAGRCSASRSRERSSTTPRSS